MKTPAKLAVCACLAILAGAARAEHPAASFTAEGLKRFLAGRVLVEMQTEQQTYTSLPKGRVFGYAWRDDGTATVCMAGLHKGRPIGPLDLDWFLVPDAESTLTWSMRVQGRKPPTRFFIPAFNPDTREIVLWLEHDGRWIVAKRAWVQDTWPAVLKAACPAMALPGLTINERQTDPDYAAMRRQDPGAPLASDSGAARCGGDFEGVATWTLDSEGNKVWNTDSCRPVQ